MTTTADATATAFAARPGGARRLAGTGTLLRFALRRDRVLIPVWVAVNALMVLSMPGTIKGLYGTAAERADLMRQMETNSSLRALVGPVFDDGLGALTAWRVGLYAGALAAVTSLSVLRTRRGAARRRAPVGARPRGCWGGGAPPRLPFLTPRIARKGPPAIALESGSAPPDLPPTPSPTQRRALPRAPPPLFCAAFSFCAPRAPHGHGSSA
ncbi:hypothetical protein STENM327S_05728 [Streptomyces tendae]